MSFVNFQAPAFRPGGSDLAVSMSPLGLLEMSDEEFEVHGPRLNRYAVAWSFYLGNHWSYRRELGEDQLTYNWVAAFADYIRRFTFGKGIQFRSPKATEAIVPRILQRVWEQDNNKELVLNEMGQQGGVGGDAYVKIAYEKPYYNHLGDMVPGRVRILPLHSAHCFATYNPHDKRRIDSFKLKYRIWTNDLSGTRQVVTYVEYIDEMVIREFINDQLIDERPNPMGFIPIVHVANQEISGSPWGASDVHAILNLNKVYNEKATELSDTLAYHASPVTIITGAKPGALEKGAKKQWSFPSPDTRVSNLELTGDQGVVVNFMNDLKMAMHELVGVPIGALGNTTPISNTSGVALLVTHQPLVMLMDAKHATYGAGIQTINSYVLRTIALYEPQMLYFDPSAGQPELQDGQLDVLDPSDPITYQSIVHWNEPFPTDELSLLNILQVKLQLGLESKRGALRAMGVENPDEKLFEMEQEQFQDLEREGALSLRRATQTAVIQALTGVNPTEGTPVEQQMQPGPDGTPVPIAPPSFIDQYANQLAQNYLSTELDSEKKQLDQLVTDAFGTRMGSRIPPSAD